MEKQFSKYHIRGSMHWREMMSRDIRKFNAVQQGRYDWLIHILGDVHGKKILDVGCGDGALSYCLTQQGSMVIGIDNEPLGIEMAQENFRQVGATGTFLVGSAYELPFESNTFDHVVCCEVIEHLEMPEKMITEVYRILKPGGIFALTTPYRLSETPTDSDDLCEFFPSQIETLLTKEFSSVTVLPMQHIFWFGMYTYSVRFAQRRQLGGWCINALALWFRWNPFMIEYSKPGKFDRFTEIFAFAKK